MSRVRFIGGPVDGGKISLEKQYNAYYIPLPPEPFKAKYEAPDTATPTVTLVMCYVYVRRGDCLIYQGEELR